MNILLSCGRSPAILDLSRRLNDFGHKVFVVDTQKIYLTKYSNSVCKSFSISSPSKDINKFFQEVKTIVEDYKIDWIIPGYEDTFYFSILQPKLEKWVKVFTSDINLLESLHDKHKVQKQIISDYVKNPETFKIIEKGLDFWLQNKSEYIFKPTFSRFGDSVFLQIKESELAKIYNQNWLAQKKLEGKELSTFAICYQGEVVKSCIYRRDMIVGLGAGIAFSFIKNENLQKFVEEQVKKLDFTGFIGFDIIQQDQEYFLLECNPRITSGIHLIDLKNFNQVLLNQMNLVDNLDSYYLLQRKILLPVLIYSLPNLLQSKISIKTFLKVIFRYKPVVFDQGDLLPFLMSIPIYIGYLLKSFTTGISVTELTGKDIHWNGKM